MHHQWMPDTVTLERSGATPELVAKLKALGHATRETNAQGDANSIGVTPPASPGERPTSGIRTGKPPPPGPA